MNTTNVDIDFNGNPVVLKGITSGNATNMDIDYHGVVLNDRHDASQIRVAERTKGAASSNPTDAPAHILILTMRTDARDQGDSSQTSTSLGPAQIPHSFAVKLLELIHSVHEKPFPKTSFVFIGIAFSAVGLFIFAGMVCPCLMSIYAMFNGARSDVVADIRAGRIKMPPQLRQAQLPDNRSPNAPQALS
jgi:hypothetical protein